MRLFYLHLRKKRIDAVSLRHKIRLAHYPVDVLKYPAVFIGSRGIREKILHVYDTDDVIHVLKINGISGKMIFAEGRYRLS